MSQATLSPAEVAERLGISAPLARRYFAAARANAEIAAGKRRRDEVPPYLTQYLDLGFPRPLRLRAVQRVRLADYEQWEARMASGTTLSPATLAESATPHASSAARFSAT